MAVHSWWFFEHAAGRRLVRRSADLRARRGVWEGGSRGCAELLVAVCDVAMCVLRLPMRCVEGCPREGPGLRVRAEWRVVMLCYVMLCV